MKNLSPAVRCALLFLLYFVLVLAFYRNTGPGRFTYDFIGWVNHFQDGGMQEAAKYYASNGLLPVYHLLMYGMYLMFGLHHLPWLIVACLLHATAALLLFLFAGKLLQGAGHTSKALPAMAGLLFLLSPLQTDAVVWGASIHYLTVTSIILVSLLLALRYAAGGNKWLIPLLCLLLFTGLFTLELALVIPVMIGFIIWLAPASLVQEGRRGKVALHIILPQLAVIIAYFLINKAVIGVYFGHYGGESVKLDVQVMTIGYLRQLIKIAVFMPYWSGFDRSNVDAFLANSTAMWVSFFVLGTIVLLGLFFYKRMKPLYQVAFLLFLLFSLALGPIVNLYAIQMVPIEFDRYTYLASSLYFAMILILFCAMWRYLQYAVALVYLVVSIIFLTKTTAWWADAGRIREGLIQDFRWTDKQHVYILAAPGALEGSIIFRGEGDQFAQNFKVYRGMRLHDRITEVAHFNVKGLNDSTQVQVLSDSVALIKTPISGTWLWKGFQGLPDYETDVFKVKTGHLSYEFILKMREPGAVYIYSAGPKWKEIKF